MSETTPPTGSALRVLVVEDDPDVLQTTLEMLKLLGHWATGVGSAETARDRYLDGAFDVVMIDEGLPALSGLDLAEALGVRPPVRIIFATGRPPPRELPPGTQWLRKPFGLDALTDALATPASGPTASASRNLR
jgi:CheY-like chemotaxis protein